MPIYEYECRKCGHSFDAMQKVSDGPLRKCPECGALKLQRLVSAPQFRLKGTGWYETDFKKDGRKRLVDGSDAKPAAADGDKADKPEKADKTDKAEAKADKKPAAGTSTAAAD
jgi:putative FmdB family regulatory protein